MRQAYPSAMNYILLQLYQSAGSWKEPSVGLKNIVVSGKIVNVSYLTLYR